MSEAPPTHTFPASKLGSFLRAMEDPEGTGKIDPAREREISVIERSLAPDDSTPDQRPPGR